MTCPRHKHCAYTGTEPGLCQVCHASEAKCAGRHGGAPYDKWSRGIAGGSHATLRVGQYNDPREAAKASSPLATPPDHMVFEGVSA